MLSSRPRADKRPLTAWGKVGLWIAVVALASGLPAVAASAAGWKSAPVVLPPMVAFVLVIAGVRISHPLRPLTTVLAASVAGLWLVTVGTTLAASWTGAQPLAVQILFVNGAKIMPLALVSFVLFQYRPNRADSALRVGDWSASSGLRVFGYDLDWRWIGGGAAIVLCGAIVLSGAGSFSADGLRGALSWLPVIAVAAVINSAAEELIFRHAINAVTRPLLGRTALVVLTSLYFGVSHINGTPSGLHGVLLAGAFGLLLAWAIERTGGFCWNWTLHFIADLAIFFTLIALAHST